MNRAFALAAWVSLLGTAAAAQSAGSVSGVVRATGDSAQPLAGARISADGNRLIVIADGHGSYRLRGLGSGWHVITAAAIGYRPQSRDSVLVREGQDTPLDFRL